MFGLGALTRKIFGTANDRTIKAMRPLVEKTNALEPQFEALSDEELRGKTIEFRERLSKGESLDALLPEAFAATREAARRALGLRAFDVQIMGGISLHRGGIAEMRTGEGKTLVATMPVYLNALEQKGVHVVTVNDYLAKRDAEWMGKVYAALGLTTGVILGGMSKEARRAAYASDVTYGTNNELGFDYLRDNMESRKADMVQRGHRYAIVDEVDSILIDEARTPLIISGPGEDSSQLYRTIDTLIPKLEEGGFEVEEKHRAATLTEEGNEAVEAMLREQGLMQEEASLYDPDNISLLHHVNQALRAHKLYTRDKDYIVKDGRVILIDEFTGRMMDGRRLSDGLHQAIEAKERANIQPENQTMASVTFQNYFRLYDKLAGMTGTAMTEAEEFHDIYKLNVVDIPTNRPIAREDVDDEVYRTETEKYDAILAEIDDARSKGQPILVGTTSIERSEILAKLLEGRGYTRKNVRDPDAFKTLYNAEGAPGEAKVFAVLNAREHENEAQIVAQAGVPGAITIATNMAGRGTDIQLGGNAEMRIEHELGDMAAGEERDTREAEIRAEIEALKARALAAGGLYVLATERHESRRIDNQLRGRSGRQGDPGKSKFYLSLQDDLMRIFGSERMDKWLQRLGLEDGEAIIHPWVNKAIERAQAKVEARNFDFRKNLLKFDDVMNDQRKAVFAQRMEIMESEQVDDVIADMRHALIDDLVVKYMPPRSYADQWDMEGMATELNQLFGQDFPVVDWAAEEGVADDEIRERLYKKTDELAAQKTVQVGPERMRSLEKEILLGVIDHDWRQHLTRLDHLRQVIGLRGYAQRDPLNEYKSEAFTLFNGLLSGLRGGVVSRLMRIDEILARQRQQWLMQYLQSPEGQKAVELQLQAKGVDMTKDQEVEIDTPFGPTTIALRGSPPPRPRRGGDWPRWDGETPLNAEGEPQDPAAFQNVSRNDPCPCGSGQKYKHCHGRLS